jgi:hypothetical protein
MGGSEGERARVSHVEESVFQKESVIDFLLSWILALMRFHFSTSTVSSYCYSTTACGNEWSGSKDALAAPVGESSSTAGMNSLPNPLLNLLQLASATPPARRGGTAAGEAETLRAERERAQCHDSHMPRKEQTNE